MRIPKLLLIVTLSAFAFVSVHTALPSVVVAQDAIQEEVIPDNENVPDSETQYPTIDNEPSEQYQEPDNSDSENENSDESTDEDNLAIFELYRSNKNRG